MTFSPSVGVLLATEAEIYYLPKYSLGLWQRMVLLASTTYWKQRAEGRAMGEPILFVGAPEFHHMLYIFQR